MELQNVGYGDELALLAVLLDVGAPKALLHGPLGAHLVAACMRAAAVSGRDRTVPARQAANAPAAREAAVGRVALPSRAATLSSSRSRTLWLGENTVGQVDSASNEYPVPAVEPSNLLRDVSHSRAMCMVSPAKPSASIPSLYSTCRSKP